MDKEAEWIKKLIDGDSLEKNKVLAEIRSKYFDRIENYVLRNNGTHNDAEDAFQEGLIVLYDNILLGKFERRSSVFTYFFAICRNKYLSSKTKIQTQEFPVNVQIPTEERFPIIDSNLINEILESLTDSCKRILKEYYIEGLSQKEI